MSVEKRDGSKSGCRSAFQNIDERNAIDGESETINFIAHETSTPVQDINKVLEACKFGRFHIRLLFAAFSGCMASFLVTNSTSYLLPVAECDLDMNLRQKGLLTSIPYFGMLLSAMMSGFLTDTFGRIIFIRIAYGGLFIFALISTTSQNFEMIAVAKLGEGFFSAMGAPGLFSIVAEFCHPGVRDRLLLVKSSFNAIAQLISPLMAWAILTRKWDIIIFEDFFGLKIWNFYLLVVSSWSLITCIIFNTIPESPKFLATKKKYRAAKNILLQVYKENTGQAAETFPYQHLWNQNIEDEIKLKKTESHLKSIRRQVLGSLKSMKPLLRRPLICYLVVIGVMRLTIMTTYNVLRLWFPQLSTIVEHSTLDGTQNLCVLLDTYTAAEKLKRVNLTLNVTQICVPHSSGTETYVNSIIMGIVCLLPYLISGIFVNKFGKKNLLIVSGFICIGGLLGIRWAGSKTVMVALFSTDVAILETMKSLAGILLVEVFPTNMRSLTSAIVMCITRIGSLVGHIGFPVLLDMGCEIPFYVMTGIIICCIASCLFSPKKNNVQNI